MPETHKWKITVERDGSPVVFTNPNGDSALDHIPIEGTISEVLMKIKKYMNDEIQKREH